MRSLRASRRALSLGFHLRVFSNPSRSCQYSLPSRCYTSTTQEAEGSEESYTEPVYYPTYTEKSFEGISVAPFPPKVVDKLLSPIEPGIIEIKPDGHLYLPEIFYRRILNSTFGPGGWALMPRGEPVLKDKTYVREWALFCYGRFVAQAGGEQEQLNENFGPSTAMEAIKSQALMRCCKDIGVASELWDHTFINEWRNQHAIKVWCENVKTGQKRILWRRKDREPFTYPWRETSGEPPAETREQVDRGHLDRPRSSPKKAQPAPTPAEQPQQAVEGEFDPNDRLPPQLKKYAGKKWSEVLATEDGRKYLEYLIKNYEGQAKQACMRALAYWKAHQVDPS